MAKLRAILLFMPIMVLALAVSAMAAGSGVGTDSGSFAGTSVTTSQSAVFAAFLSNLAEGADPVTDPAIDTAISVSNVLVSGHQSDFLDLSGGDTKGTVEIFLWNQDGTALDVFNTGDFPTVGIGTDDDGVLWPGQTYTVLLRDILGAVTGDPNTTFVGFGWVLGNFDGIAGTYNVTIFGIGFTQNFELTPAVGQGLSGTAGLPVN